MTLPKSIENKKVLLVGGGALLLIIILLLPARGRREVDLPPGFERAVPHERQLPVTLAPVAVVAEREVTPPPEIIEEAQRRHALDWGRDPFLVGEIEVEMEVQLRLRLEAIFMPMQKAIINGREVAIGDKIGKYEVVNITEGVVTLEKEGITHRLLF